MSLKKGSWAASSMLISSMFWQNSAIHAVSSACSRWPPAGCGALRSNIIQPQKASFKEVLPRRSLRFTHPTEIQHQLGKRPLRSSISPSVFRGLFSPVQEEGCPDVHGRIDVAEVPIVGRDLSGRMPEELLPHQVELFFSEIHVNCGERNGVDRQVPGGTDQGYSHLSGIEMRGSFTMWNHSPFRMCRCPRCCPHPPQERLRRTRPPSSRLAKPESRQHVESGGVRPTVEHSDLDQDVLGVFFASWTNTSKKWSLLNTPVSSNSYSMSPQLRCLRVRTTSSYGNTA